MYDYYDAEQLRGQSYYEMATKGIPFEFSFFGDDEYMSLGGNETYAKRCGRFYVGGRGRVVKDGGTVIEYRISATLLRRTETVFIAKESPNEEGLWIFAPEEKEYLLPAASVEMVFVRARPGHLLGVDGTPTSHFSPCYGHA
jgi:hypothetical protein